MVVIFFDPPVSKWAEHAVANFSLWQFRFKRRSTLKSAGSQCNIVPVRFGWILRRKVCGGGSTEVAAEHVHKDKASRLTLRFNTHKHASLENTDTVSNKQLNERQLSKMVREAASPPADRLRKIREVLADMNYSRNLYFKEFGLQISEEFLKVEAKVLDPPKLRHGNSVVEPRNGQWIGNRMQQGATLKLWGFIAIDLNHQGSNSLEIIGLMKSCGRQMGIMVEEPCLLKYNVRIQELESVMKEALGKNLQLLFVAMPTRGREIYSQVKKVAERNVGMLTQCLREQTATRRMNQQTARNILLKVNSKLMGINQILDSTTLPKCLRGGDVMVVGADVTHPSPDQKEMIVEFEDMMVEHLKLYKKRLGFLPKKIYVFRDGVSEGQFAEVMNSELQAVYNAYRTLSGTEVKPKVLFQLVQKRHHTRMFTDSNPPRNVEPGTVVDKEIVHVRELDFYLVSHQAIKGTARPTRYHAVCNDDKLPHDEVEQLTYYLCHLYSRCLRSVSYPTPTYYAHLACLRARVLTQGEKFDNSKLERQPQRLRVFDRILQQSPMFFV
ncbi:Protein argonaute-2 [Eumeta japonica]|uniref:Protein argonaute-2 n=1 Tax=Eumeta variegata TaxID=151549 RepID=A0A4C1V5D5_EUMVA|nr:Protein argonaute-2 [Eumeta japonica]